MKKNLFITVTIALLLISCGKETGETLVRKRILQHVDKIGQGMVKDVELEKFEKVNDSTYLGTHSFFNAMFDKDIRVTKNYSFTIDLDSITKTEDVKSEMKSQGEWVKMSK